MFKHWKPNHHDLKENSTLEFVVNKQANSKYFTRKKETNNYELQNNITQAHLYIDNLRMCNSTRSIYIELQFELGAFI